MTTATRLARPEDLTAALDVWRRANTARGKTPGPERVARVQVKLADPAALVVLAERGGELLGLALAETGRDRDGAGGVVPGLCHVSMVFVCPDHWGNRIGELLLDAVCERAVRRGQALLQLQTGERYRRIARRRGKKKAIVAIGRSVLVIIWHLLSDEEARFHDLGSDFYTPASTPNAANETTSANSKPSAIRSPSRQPPSHNPPRASPPILSRWPAG